MKRHFLMLFQTEQLHKRPATGVTPVSVPKVHSRKGSNKADSCNVGMAQTNAKHALCFTGLYRVSQKQTCAPVSASRFCGAAQQNRSSSLIPLPECPQSHVVQRQRTGL